MIKHLIHLIIILLVLILLASCNSSKQNVEENINSSNSTENVISEDNNTEDDSDLDEINSKLTIGTVLNISIDDIEAIEIAKRNISEISICTLNDEDVALFAEKLLSIPLEEFEPTKFDPITGGDIVYTIYVFEEEKAEIYYDGSFTILDDKYLPSENFDLKIPNDVLWNTKKTGF